MTKGSRHKIFLLSISFIGLVYEVGTQKFVAISNHFYAQHLYQRIKNEDAPSTSDPANTDKYTRNRICEEITNSGFFQYCLMYPVKRWEIFFELHREYSEIFHQMFSRRMSPIKKLLLPYKYTNPYRRRQFNSLNTNEFVFVCLLRKTTTNSLVPHYVSKVYNVNEENHGVPFKPGRFVFRDGSLGVIQRIFMVEQPAEAYERPDFNVELFYLRMRSIHKPATDDHLDPVCKLYSEEDVMRSQHHRLCSVILTSSYFKDELRYPIGSFQSGCNEEAVHFRTTQARELAVEESYSERMLMCPALAIDGGYVKFVYVSRAYITNQVFVYSLDIRQNAIYLENLSTNLAFVHEHTSFDDVE